jgi:hypothetical protein
MLLVPPSAGLLWWLPPQLVAPHLISQPGDMCGSAGACQLRSTLCCLLVVPHHHRPASCQLGAGEGAGVHLHTLKLGCALQHKMWRGRRAGRRKHRNKLREKRTVINSNF